MDVVLVRHAIAVERGTAGFEDDRARPLTADGRRRMREVTEGLKNLVGASVILTSPILRARQTAEILSDSLKVPVSTLDALGNGRHEEVIASLAAARESSVILVGHQPWMSELLSVMMTGNPQTVFSEFKKGAAALVSFDGPVRAGAGALRWLIQPGALRKLAH